MFIESSMQSSITRIAVTDMVNLARGHLYRLHAPPISCPRCFAEFKHQDEVILHLRGEDICTLMPPPPLDKSTTFTEAQMQELKRRPSKSMGSRNEIEQCKEMYRILFPSASLPDSLC